MVTQDVTLHEVWCSNTEEEFAKLRMIIEEYPYVAMDTEFLGVVVTPMGIFRSKKDFNYQQLLCSVNALKLIQVGFTLVDSEGRLSPNNDVWQFNFHFSLSEDMFSSDSIDLFWTAGFGFNKHQTEGILMKDFGELLTTSGFLVDKRISWLTFHSCFDFGSLIKSILLGELPTDENEFFSPAPVAAMLKGSLQDVADQLQVVRIGQQHQAGSDSLLTAMTFFKLKERFFGDNWEEVATEVQEHMYGLNS